MPSAAAVRQLRPVRRQALSDSVFEQLRDQIVSGELAVGDALPAERLLCEALGVNRGSIREALRRLQQARLVDVRHGGTSRVLDFRKTAGLDLLSSLLVTPAGAFDARVVRSVMEMRSALAPDIARLAALRGQATAPQLQTLVAKMRETSTDASGLQLLTAEFWSLLVDAADNVAYRLAFNSLMDTYARCRELLLQVLGEELRDTATYQAIAKAVGKGDGAAAEKLARALVRRGESGINAVLAQLESSTRRKSR